MNFSKVMSVFAAFGLVIAPVAAQAGTRASSSMPEASSAGQSSTEDDDDDDKAGLFAKWGPFVYALFLAGGIAAVMAWIDSNQSSGAS